jgi:lysophospholipase L1-like esterase
MLAAGACRHPSGGYHFMMSSSRLNPVVGAAVLLASASGNTVAAAASATTNAYVALGDSSGVGVGAKGGGYVDRLHRQLQTLRPDIELLNLCRSGATSARVLSDQVPRLRPGTHALVTVGVGVNDLKGQVPAEVFAERFEAIMAGVRQRTSGPIVVTNLPDVSLAPIVPRYLQPLVAQQVQAYNRAIATAARRHQALLIDTYDTSRREIPRHPEFFSADGFHPSDAGYQFWAGVMWPEVKGLLQKK